MSGVPLFRIFQYYHSSAHTKCASNPAINGNGRSGRNGGTFPFIISVFSVCSVAMATIPLNPGHLTRQWLPHLSYPHLPHMMDLHAALLV
jgi:hypothetical protein